MRSHVKYYPPKRCLGAPLQCFFVEQWPALSKHSGIHLLSWRQPQGQEDWPWWLIRVIYPGAVTCTWNAKRRGQGTSGDAVLPPWQAPFLCLPLNTRQSVPCAWKVGALRRFYASLAWPFPLDSVELPSTSPSV
jgi:hypothetical protein